MTIIITGEVCDCKKKNLMTLRHKQKDRHAGTIVGFLQRIIIIILKKSELLLMEGNDM